jgi:biopolymer transport protein ExbD
VKFKRRRPEQAEINLASLIDVVFILLLFFVVSTTFVRETRMQVDLPEASSASQPDSAEKKPLEVLIGADGSFALNGKSLIKSDLHTLMGALQKESAGDSSLPLTISADANASHQSVVTAMDAAGKLGFAHLRITTLDNQVEP